MTTEQRLQGLASSIKMKGSSTPVMMMMDGEDGLPRRVGKQLGR